MPYLDSHDQIFLCLCGFKAEMLGFEHPRRQSPPLCLLIGQKNTTVFWHQSEVRMAATVWNWSGKTLSPGALLAVLYFSSCHIFPPVWTFPRPPLSAPGSPRMLVPRMRTTNFLTLESHLKLYLVVVQTKLHLNKIMIILTLELRKAPVDSKI